MKIKNYKFLSIILVIGFILCIIPSKSVSAKTVYDITLSDIRLTYADKDYTFAGYHAAKTIEGNKKRYYYLMENIYSKVTAKVNNSSQKKFTLDVGIYDYNTYQTTFLPTQRGLLTDKLSIKLPQLSEGHYTIYLCISGMSIYSYSTSFELTVVKKDALKYCANVYTHILGKNNSIDCYRDAGSLTGHYTTARKIADSAYANSNLESLNNNDFVTKLYKGFLQRDPDPDGYNFWINKLKTHSKHDIFMDFMYSYEFEHIICKYIPY